MWCNWNPASFSASRETGRWSSARRCWQCCSWQAAGALLPGTHSRTNLTRFEESAGPRMADPVTGIVLSSQYQPAFSSKSSSDYWNFRERKKLGYKRCGSWGLRTWGNCFPNGGNCSHERRAASALWYDKPNWAVLHGAYSNRWPILLLLWLRLTIGEISTCGRSWVIQICTNNLKSLTFPQKIKPIKETIYASLIC